MIDGEMALRRGPERLRLRVGTAADAAAEIRGFVADEVRVVTAFGDEIPLAGAELAVFAALLDQRGAADADSPLLTVLAWQATGDLDEVAA